MKKLMMLFVMLLITMGVSAQTQKFSKWTITPRVGFNITKISVGDGIETDSKAGFTGGVDAEYRPIKWVGASLGCYFATANSNYDYTEFLRSSYFDFQEHYHSVSMQKIIVPLMVNAHVYKGLTAKIGVQLNYLLRARTKMDFTGYYIRPSSNSHLTYDDHGQIEGEHVEMNETESVDVKRAYNKSTLSLPVALSYEYKNIELEACYNIGSYGIASARSSRYNKCFSLTIGYRFHL